MDGPGFDVLWGHVYLQFLSRYTSVQSKYATPRKHCGKGLWVKVRGEKGNFLSEIQERAWTEVFCCVHVTLMLENKLQTLLWRTLFSMIRVGATEMIMRTQSVTISQCPLI